MYAVPNTNNQTAKMKGKEEAKRTCYIPHTFTDFISFLTREMMTSLKVSSVPAESQKVIDSILASSAVQDGAPLKEIVKRAYLNDFKPFSSVFSPSNITVQIAKAALLPANILLNDFNAYMDQYDLNNPEANDNIPPYDWDTALNKFWRSFLYDGPRYLITSILRKSLEEYALQNFSLKLTDQLTKDVYKSLLRKDARFGRAQRLEVCRRMFFTTWRGTSLTYLSFYIYDSVVVTWQHVFGAYLAMTKEKKSFLEALQTLDMPSLLWKIIKKAIFQVTSVTAQAAGFAAGSYFNLKYGGTVGGMVFEVLASLILSQFISTNDNPDQLQQVHMQLDELKKKRAKAKKNNKFN